MERKALGPRRVDYIALSFLLWGLTRHEWGNIHYWLAIGLMATLSLHLVQHWQWIVCMVKGKPTQGSAIRAALGIVGLASLLALALAPFLSSTERMPRWQVLQQREQVINSGEESGGPGAAQEKKRNSIQADSKQTSGGHKP